MKKNKQKSSKVNPLREAKRQRRQALKKKTTIGVTSRKAIQGGKALKARAQQLARSQGLKTPNKSLQKSLDWNRNRIQSNFDEKYNVNDFKDITSGIEIDLQYVKNAVIDPYKETGFNELVSVLNSMDDVELYVREIFVGDDADISQSWENYHEFSVSDIDVWIVRDGEMVTKEEEEARLIGVWTRSLTSEEQKMIQDIKDQMSK